VIHTRGDQCIALKIDRLTLVGGGDSHVADHHVPKTPHHMFSHTTGIRQGLSYVFTVEARSHFLGRARSTGIK